jgi:colicin import membrane protein
LTFDRSEPGLWLSGGAHVALFLVGVLSFSSTKLPDADEGIPVEVITDNQFSEITKGELQAKQPQPVPKPRAERQADTRQERDPGEAKQDAPAPPKRPAEMKVAEEEAAAPPSAEKVAEAAPPPPPSRAEAAKAEAAKAEAAKAEAQKLTEKLEAEAIENAKLEAAKKAEADAKARADAKAKAEAKAAEAKAQAELKALAEAAKAEAEAKAKAEAARQKAVAEAKTLAHAKAKAEAEAKARKQAELADKFDAGDIRQLLASKAPSQSAGAAAPEINKTASLGTASGNAQRLNPSQRDQLMGLLRDQLHRCWQAPMASQGNDKPPVPSVRVKLNQDGSLAAEPAVMNPSSDALFRTVADSATRATRRCAPLKIPAQFAPYYQDWKDLVVNFDPREMG